MKKILSIGFKLTIATLLIAALLTLLQAVGVFTPAIFPVALSVAAAVTVGSEINKSYKKSKKASKISENLLSSKYEKQQELGKEQTAQNEKAEKKN
jgi:hypothetical protein